MATTKIFLMYVLILPLIHTRVIPDDTDFLSTNLLDSITGGIVPRSGWNARPPTEIEVMQNPVPYVVIHHTYEPAACYTFETCVAAMEWMQDYHQYNRSWADIGYNFAVGGDDRIYEGRGWSRVGAHAPSYNNCSIGIAVIGDWNVELPPKYQLEKVKELIQYGVENGKIMENYKLVGHRQVRNDKCTNTKITDIFSNWSKHYQNWTHFEILKELFFTWIKLGTDCPGDRLFEEIKTWPQWDPTAKPPRVVNASLAYIP